MFDEGASCEQAGEDIAVGTVADQACAFDTYVQARDEFVPGDGLCQVVVTADFEGGQALGRIGPVGEKEDGQVNPGRDGAQDAADFKTAHGGRAGVE